MGTHAGRPQASIRDCSDPLRFPPGRPKESLLPPRGEANAVSSGGYDLRAWGPSSPLTPLSQPTLPPPIVLHIAKAPASGGRQPEIELLHILVLCEILCGA